MRPIEVVLSAANLLAFFSLIIPLPHTLSWMRYAAPVALLAAVAQAAIEGPRWQMAPAYALAAILFLIWLGGIVAADGLRVNRVIVGIGIGLGALMMLVAIALPIVLPVFHFPKPTGPYAIGTVTYHWVDASRPEIFTTDPNDHRELVAQVWYPAQDEPSAPRAPYLPDSDLITPEIARVFHLPGFFFTYFKYVTTHAVESAPVAGDRASYPVLIYLTGLNGFRQVNTFQVEELVSHGYIVVGLDQPYASVAVPFPNGRLIIGWTRDQLNPLVLQSGGQQPVTPTISGQPLPDGILPYLAQDASFALDQLALLNQADPNNVLTGRLDLGHAGTFGVSLGAENAAEVCAKDARLKACLMMDGFVPADALKTGIKQPSMWITRPADTMRLERSRSGGWAESDISMTIDSMRAAYQSLPGDGYYVQMPTMFHINFTDAPAWSPILSSIGLTGPIDGLRGFNIVNAYSVAFFDKELKGQPSPLLDGSASPYPEATIEARRP